MGKSGLVKLFQPILILIKTTNTTKLPKRAVEDVVMTDTYPAEYERDIPMFIDETEDAESFIEILNRERFPLCDGIYKPYIIRDS